MDAEEVAGTEGNGNAGENRVGSGNANTSTSSSTSSSTSDSSSGDTSNSSSNSSSIQTEASANKKGRRWDNSDDDEEEGEESKEEESKEEEKKNAKAEKSQAAGTATVVAGPEEAQASKSKGKKRVRWAEQLEHVHEIEEISTGSQLHYFNTSVIVRVIILCTPFCAIGYTIGDGGGGKRAKTEAVSGEGRFLKSS